MAVNDVENEESDFSAGVRWANAWQAMFFSLYCIVMLISLALFFCLVRAVAKLKERKETPIYFFLFFLFFISLVEDSLIIQQFIMIYHKTKHTNTLCQLFSFVVYGNKCLQAFTVLALLTYTFVFVQFKRTVIEQRAKRFFPLIVIVLLVFELLFAIWPALNVRASSSEQFCYHVDASYSNQRRTGWLYLVLYPYFIPVMMAVFPVVKLALKLRDKSLLDTHAVQARITLVVVIGYFFFHLLYYTLMLGRETEALILERSEWRKLLGLHVWYITRPMFALIGYGWFITIPLAPFVFDPDLMTEFPGNWINKEKIALKEEENRNSICMSDTSSSRRTPPETLNRSDNEEVGVGHVTWKEDGNRNSFENAMHADYHDPDRIDASEYNQASIV